jgi:hypothetical protein
MTFTAKDSGKKKSRDDRAAAAKAAEAAAEEETVKADGPPPPFVDPASHGHIAEEDLKVKKGGCGCSVAPVERLDFGAAGVCVALVALPFLRRRRSAS